MNALAGTILVITALLGIVLTVLSLPGIWLMVLVALGVELWQPALLSWWTIGGLFLIALIAETIETLASAAGARKAGGSKRAALGAILGAIAGAILGTPLIPIPLVGTLIGAALGAGVTAILLELTKTQAFELDVLEPDAVHPGVGVLRRRKMGHAMRVGKGAAIARIYALIIKTIFAIGTAAVLIVAAVM